jgi:thioredoxin reductase (NADPH)
MAIPINMDINLHSRPNPADGDTFDVIIVGGGPAGLTAALYNSRSGRKVLMIEKIAAGGQIFITAEIENYPGIDRISGPELSGIMESQALKFGTRLEFDEVERIIDSGDNFKHVTTAGGKTYRAPVVILSTGAKYKDIGVPGEELYRGKGVSNCATCDGAFYKGLEVAVVGGGDTAVEEGDYLTRFASRVHIIHRRDKLRACKIAQDRAFKNPKINFILDTVVEEIKGGTKGVEKLALANVKTGAKSELNVSGAFIFVGFNPNTSFLKGFVEMDSQNYIITDKYMNTSRKGVFACGDCIQKSLRQVVTAAGDGAVASDSAEHYLESLKDAE